MSERIELPTCTLQNEKARAVVLDFWERLDRAWKDTQRLHEIVHLIAPLPQEDLDDGTVGQWLRGKGTLLLRDNDDLTRGDVAHEFGHAITTEDDLYERGGPTDEWASEAAADMHAVRWYALTRAEILRRYQRNVEGWDPEVHGYGSAWAHHGPAPGGPPIQIYGGWWRLGWNFDFIETTEEGRRLPLTPEEIADLVSMANKKGDSEIGLLGRNFSVSTGMPDRNDPNKPEYIKRPHIWIEEGVVTKAECESDHTHDEIVWAGYQLLKARREKKQAIAAKAAKTRAARRELRFQQVVLSIRNNALKPGTKCRICGKALTDDESIRRGIGPECWQGVLRRIENDLSEKDPEMEKFIVRVGRIHA